MGESKPGIGSLIAVQPASKISMRQIPEFRLRVPCPIGDTPRLRISKLETAFAENLPRTAAQNTCKPFFFNDMRDA
jgi:hypothetical protein